MIYDIITIFVTKTNFFLCIYIIFLQNADQIFSSKVRKHMLLFINTTVESQNALLEDFRDVASEFKEKVSLRK